jgi:hypothetical protein
MARIITVDFTMPSKYRENLYRKRWRQRGEWLRRLKNHNLVRNYGISLEEYEVLLRKQRGVCAICRGKSSIKRQRYLDVDHDKDTKKIRGLLCNHCNRGIAFLRHDTKLLSAAIDYLFSCAEELL